MITTNAEECRTQIAPLYHRYHGQTAVQPAYLTIDPLAWEMKADYQRYIGNYPSSLVWHNLQYRLPLPPNLCGVALSNFLRNDAVIALVEIICASHRIKSGRGYLTQEGMKAIEKLELEHLRWGERDFIPIDVLVPNLYP